MEYTNVYWTMSGYPYLLVTSSSAQLFHIINNPLSSIISAHICTICGRWGMSNLSFIGHISKGRWAIAISSTERSGALGTPPVPMLELSLMHPMFQALSSHQWTPVAPLDEADLDCKDVGQEIETLGWGWLYIQPSRCEETILLGASEEVMMWLQVHVTTEGWRGRSWT